jgi:hypothetical protein
MTSQLNRSESVRSSWKLEWTNDDMPPPYSPDLQTRGTGKRPLAAAHAGFGFGATIIRDKSLQSAREADSRKKSKLQELLNAPLSTPSATAPLTDKQEATRSAAAIVPPAPEATSRPERRTQHKNIGVIPPRVYGSKARAQPQPSRDATEQATSVSMGRAMLAWILDTIFTSSALVIAMGASYVSSVPQFGAPLVRALNNLATLAGSSNPFMLVMAFKVLLSALGFVFVAQFSILLITGSTIGRFAMGIRAAGDGVFSRVATSVVMALSETLTCGGLLSLPFIVSMPSRAPLAPWIKLESSQN